MNNKVLIAITVIIGYFTLLFFPEPETNFLFYLLTAFFFLGIILYLIFKDKNSK